MKIYRLHSFGCLCFCLSAAPLYAQDVTDWQPVKPSRPISMQFHPAQPVKESDEDEKTGDFRKNLSAVAWSPNQRQLWLVSDENVLEAPSIERLTIQEPAGTLADHESILLGNYISLPEPASKDDPVGEVDGEAICIDGGYLWLTGSHSLTRKKFKESEDTRENLKRLGKVKKLAPNRFTLARIPLKTGSDGSDELLPSEGGRHAARLYTLEPGGLLDLLGGDPHLKAFTALPSKDNGLDVEGLVVSGSRIFLGLRGPVLHGWAVILEISIEDSETPGNLRLAPVNPQGDKFVKHFIRLNGLGIRDLVMDGSDMLILAGPAMDADGPAAVFRLANAFEHLPVSNSFTSASEQYLRKILNLPFGTRVDHAEGIALMPGSTANSKSVLVIYDSPAKARLHDPAEYHADIFDLPN